MGPTRSGVCKLPSSRHTGLTRIKNSLAPRCNCRGRGDEESRYLLAAGMLMDSPAPDQCRPIEAPDSRTGAGPRRRKMMAIYQDLIAGWARERAISPCQIWAHAAGPACPSRPARAPFAARGTDIDGQSKIAGGTPCAGGHHTC